MVAWYSADTPEEQQRISAAWADAPIANEELCGFILDTAQLQVREYAPQATMGDALAAVLLRYGVADKLPDVLAVLGATTTEPPFNYVLAQLQQARNLWNAGRTSGEGEVGPDGYVFRPYPLDKTIKQIIRPIDGTPHVL
jgi:hypothetical protein